MEKIFSYIDYRQFLAEYYLYMKSSTSYFSYRWFTKKAGFTSPGLYQRLVKGERNLTAKTIEQAIVGLGITDKEAEYFRVLVAFNQATVSSEKQRNYTIMLSMAQFVKEHQLEADQYTFLNRWYVPVLRELVTILPFGKDYGTLAKAVFPAITPIDYDLIVGNFVAFFSGFVNQRKILPW